MQRRWFIKNVFSFFGAIFAFQRPRKAIAANQPTHTLSPALTELLANQPLVVKVDDDQIRLELPDIAENGAVVPITISSELENIKKITIWIDKNPTPLLAEFELNESALVFLTARIKMAESDLVTIVAQQGDRFLLRQQRVKVIQGGCGTG